MPNKWQANDLPIGIHYFNRLQNGKKEKSYPPHLENEREIALKWRRVTQKRNENEELLSISMRKTLNSIKLTDERTAQNSS